VNLSDDGWYGDTSAPWEHLDMVRMRAIENNRWVLRSTNTGVTASIDPYGRIVDQMPRHVRGALLARFNFIDGITFYTHHGDWIAWICAVLTGALIAVSLLRSRSQPAAQ
jgi:apolipoprotein N-acyltransferase